MNQRFLTCFRALLREKEASAPTGSAYLLAAASIVFILCDKSIAAIALTFVAVGDPVAGMVGERWGKAKTTPENPCFARDAESRHDSRARLPKLLCKVSNFARSAQNLKLPGMPARNKTFIGNSACLVACLVSGIILAIITNVALWLVVIGAVCATAIEFLSPPPDDNFTIPLVAGGVMSLVNFAVIS